MSKVIPYKPKKGDRISLKVIGYGLVSYEHGEIERVRLKQVWIEGRKDPYLFPEGRGDGHLGLRVDVVFDDGLAAAQYEESGE